MTKQADATIQAGFKAFAEPSDWASHISKFKQHAPQT